MTSRLECPLCLDSAIQPRVTQCGHVFCKDCLDSCFDNRSHQIECPCCRKPVLKSKIITLYVPEIDPYPEIPMKPRLEPVNEEWSLVHQACRNGDIVGLRRLVESGLSANTKSSQNTGGLTPLHLACAKGHLHVIEYLVHKEPLLKEVRSDKYGLLPIHSASLTGNIQVVDYFLTELNVDIESVNATLGRTSLHFACSKGHLELARYLVEKGANVKAKANLNELESTPIHVAAEFGYVDIVKYFVEEVDSSLAYVKNRHGEIATHRAAQKGHIEVVEYFLSKNVDIEVKCSKFRRTMLHMASATGHLGLVRLLVSRAADFTVQDVHLSAPVHLASFFGHLGVVCYLVDSVDSNLVFAKSQNGVIPLHKAALRGNIEVADFLLKRKSPIDSKCDILGRTSLHMASEKGHIDFVRFLKRKGADLYVTDKQNYTALHVSAFFGQIHVVKYLVNQCPLLVKVKNQGGFIAQQLAERSSNDGCAEVVEYLKRRNLF